MRNNGTPLPLMIMDASGIMDLAQFQLDVDYNDDPNLKHSLKDIIDILSKDRTIVIPRAVYREIQSTHTGWRDIIRDPEMGELKPDLGKHYSEFRFSDAIIIHNLFSDYWQEGKLRVYENMDAMEKAGELDEMKGGIVIVDLPNRHGKYWPISEEPYFSERSNAIASTPDDVKIDFGSLPKTKRPKGKQGLGRGDNGIMELAIRLRQLAREGKLDTRYSLYTNDRGLGERLNGLYGDNPKAAGQRWPQRIQSLELIWALNKQYPEEFPKDVAEAYTNAFQREFEGKAGRKFNITETTLKYIHQASNWLEDTKAAEPEMQVDAGSTEKTAGRLSTPEKELVG